MHSSNVLNATKDSILTISLIIVTFRFNSVSMSHQLDFALNAVPTIFSAAKSVSSTPETVRSSIKVLRYALLVILVSFPIMEYVNWTQIALKVNIRTNPVLAKTEHYPTAQSTTLREFVKDVLPTSDSLQILAHVKGETISKQNCLKTLKPNSLSI